MRLLVSLLAASEAFNISPHLRPDIHPRPLTHSPPRSLPHSPTRSLPHSPPKMLLAAQLPSAILGGTLAGGLHAVTGPDHLAALLPLCMGRRWPRAASTGALWGIGHGIGAALVGAVGFALRGALNIEAVSSYMEIAVGVSIMVIGVTGFREAREWARSANECPVDFAVPAVAASGATGACDEAPKQDVSRTLINGVINGVSGTGHVLGVMPALAMPNWVIAGSYLTCFGFGTFAAMAVFTGTVGALSSKVGTKFNDPAAPANLASASSIFAMIMGSVWTGRAVHALTVARRAVRFA